MAVVEIMLTPTVSPPTSPFIPSPLPSLLPFLAFFSFIFSLSFPLPLCYSNRWAFFDFDPKYWFLFFVSYFLPLGFQYYRQSHLGFVLIQGIVESFKWKLHTLWFCIRKAKSFELDPLLSVLFQFLLIRWILGATGEAFSWLMGQILLPRTKDSSLDLNRVSLLDLWILLPLVLLKRTNLPTCLG